MFWHDVVCPSCKSIFVWLHPRIYKLYWVWNNCPSVRRRIQNARITDTREMAVGKHQPAAGIRRSLFERFSSGLGVSAMDVKGQKSHWNYARPLSSFGRPMSKCIATVSQWKIRIFHITTRSWSLSVSQPPNHTSFSRPLLSGNIMPTFHAKPPGKQSSTRCHPNQPITLAHYGGRSIQMPYIFLLPLVMLHRLLIYGLIRRDYLYLYVANSHRESDSCCSTFITSAYEPLECLPTTQLFSVHCAMVHGIWKFQIIS